MGFRIDYSNLTKQGERFFANFKGDMEKFGRIQFKGIMRRVVNATPPNKGKRTGTQAKKRGEAKIRADLKGKKGIFTPMNAATLTKAQRANPKGTVVALAEVGGYTMAVNRRLFKPDATVRDMAEFHRARFKRGKIRSRPTRQSGDFLYLRRLVVKQGAYSKYEKLVLKRVGKAAGGWNAGAKAVGYRPPAWIARQRSSGAFSIEVSDKRIRLKATNKTRNASRLANLERRIQIAVNAQAHALRRSIDFRLGQAAKRAGFK